MRHYRKVRKTKMVEELVGITCNFCSRKIIHEFHSDAPRRARRDPDAVSGGTVTITFGYPSAFDLHTHEFDVCDACFKKRFLPFAPHVTNVSAWGERLSK
jgi:hypothetical protein